MVSGEGWRLDNPTILNVTSGELLTFLRENAGRTFTLRFLMNKFGYTGKGSTALIRKDIDFYLELGYPVGRIVRGRDSGALYCTQDNQLEHFAKYHDSISDAHKRKASMYRLAAEKMRRTEI